MLVRIRIHRIFRIFRIRMPDIPKNLIRTICNYSRASETRKIFHLSQRLKRAFDFFYASDLKELGLKIISNLALFLSL
jgi:hypothetical protein